MLTRLFRSPLKENWTANAGPPTPKMSSAPNNFVAPFIRLSSGSWVSGCRTHPAHVLMAAGRDGVFRFCELFDSCHQSAAPGVLPPGHSKTANADNGVP